MRITVCSWKENLINCSIPLWKGVGPGNHWLGSVSLEAEMNYLRPPCTRSPLALFPLAAFGLHSKQMLDKVLKNTYSLHEFPLVFIHLFSRATELEDQPSLSGPVEVLKNSWVKHQDGKPDEAEETLGEGSLLFESISSAKSTQNSFPRVHKQGRGGGSSTTPRDSDQLCH